MFFGVGGEVGGSFPAMSKSLKNKKKKKNHWTHRVQESVLCRDADGGLGFQVKGGAENGRFPLIGGGLTAAKGTWTWTGTGTVVGGGLDTRLPSRDDLLPLPPPPLLLPLLLEVNETPVAGLTTRDVHAVLRHCKDPVRLKFVRQGKGFMKCYFFCCISLHEFLSPSEFRIRTRSAPLESLLWDNGFAKDLTFTVSLIWFLYTC